MTFIIVVLWLTIAYIVVRIVAHLGKTLVQKIAWYVGTAFALVGVGVTVLWLFALMNTQFSVHLDTYLMTHQLKPGNTVPVIIVHDGTNGVTVFRNGSVNDHAILSGSTLTIDEQQTIKTSAWWMLWDTKYGKS